MPTTLKRFQAIDRSDPSTELPIVAGNRADYLALKPHHYRAGNPMTMTRIFAIHDASPSPGDRFTGRAVQPRAVAVLIESLAALSCRLRDEALGGRYGHLRPKPRSMLLNQELRCISRVIIDPRFRGIGLAVRLVRHALATATTRYTESLAVMGKVSPFFARAGMTAYERPPLDAEQRAISALQYAGFEPHDLARPNEVESKISVMDEATQRFIIGELKRWYRTAGGRGVRRDPSRADVLRAAQQRLLAHPVYYLHENTHAPIH